MLILSIAPVVFFGYQIYKRDFDKEPTSTLIKLFFSGIGSIFLTLFITSFLQSIIPFFAVDSEKLNLIELVPYIFVGVALIEEFSKWIFVYKLEYNDNEFNHLYDGIVYAAFVSLGFACFENILYVFQYGIGTAIVRAFLAIPGHLCYGIMMGYYLSLAKLSLINQNRKLSQKNKVLSLLIPVLAHGLYDYLIFAGINTENGLFDVVLLSFVIFYFSYAAKKVKQLSTNVYNLNPNYITMRQRKQMQQQMMYPNNQQPINMPPSYAQSINTQPSYPQATVSKRYCSNCGHQVSGRFCENCGREVL